MKLIKEFDECVGKKGLSFIIGVIIQIVVFLISFWISFCCCAVYKEQQLTWIIIFCFGFVLDNLILEISIEFIISIFYSLRKNDRIWLTLCQRLNSLRNFKVLV